MRLKIFLIFFISLGLKNLKMFNHIKNIPRVVILIIDLFIVVASVSCKSSVDGAEYTGTRSMTVTGIPCQRWDHQSPHTHAFTEDDHFPDSTVTEAGNYCRSVAQSIAVARKTIAISISILFQIFKTIYYILLLYCKLLC